MSVEQIVDRYLFEGLKRNVVIAQTTGAVSTTDLPRVTICVIDYKDDDTDHDIHIWSDGVTAGSDAWILIHDNTA